MHRPQLASVLPTHPTLEHPDGRAVVALGLNRHGLPIWPVRGGADDDEDDDASDDDTDSGDDDTDDGGEDDKQLGPKGEQALAREKERRRTAQAQLREWKALGKTPAEIRALLDGGKKTDDGQPADRDAIRAEVKAEADAENLRTRVADKIEAKAGGLFSIDTEDVAVMLLRRTNVDEFIDDGKVDVEAITEALEDLLKKNPGLAAQGGKRFKGGGDGGRRKDEPAKAKTLQEAVTARLTPGGSTR